MKKLLTLILALVMCLSLASCGSDKKTETTAPETTASTTATETKVPVTTASETTAEEEPILTPEEKIYASVKAAYEATLAYKGDLTMKGTTHIVDTRSDRVDVDDDVVELTANTNGEYYMIMRGTMKSIYADETKTDSSTTMIKVAKEGENYVEYENADYSFDSEDRRSAMILNAIEVDKGNTAEDWLGDFDSVGFILSYDTFAALSAAAGKVTALDLAMTDDDESYNYKDTITVEAKTEDGCDVVLYNMYLTPVGAETMILTGLEVGFYVKDGKLVKVMYNMIIMEDRRDYTYDVTYAFDAAGFEAIKVPSTLEVKPKKDCEYPDRVIFKLGDVTTQISFSTPETGAKLQEALMQTQYKGISLLFFTDEGCTKAFDPTGMTAEEAYFAMKDGLYAKADVQEGYALIVTSMGYDYSQLDPDVVKLMTMGASEGEAETNVTLVQLSTLEDGMFDVSGYADDPKYSFTVNGAPFTGKSVKLESGKTYQMAVNMIVSDYMMVLGG